MLCKIVIEVQEIHLPNQNCLKPKFQILFHKKGQPQDFIKRTLVYVQKLCFPESLGLGTDFPCLSGKGLLM